MYSVGRSECRFLVVLTYVCGIRDNRTLTARHSLKMTCFHRAQLPLISEKSKATCLSSEVLQYIPINHFVSSDINGRKDLMQTYTFRQRSSAPSRLMCMHLDRCSVFQDDLRPCSPIGKNGPLIFMSVQDALRCAAATSVAVAGISNQQHRIQGGGRYAARPIVKIKM